MFRRAVASHSIQEQFCCSWRHGFKLWRVNDVARDHAEAVGRIAISTIEDCIHFLGGQRFLHAGHVDLGQALRRRCLRNTIVLKAGGRLEQARISLSYRDNWIDVEGFDEFLDRNGGSVVEFDEAVLIRLMFVVGEARNPHHPAKVDTGAAVETFLPRNVVFKKGKREKLERYLDVTRAELFFARRVIFVEGAAELMMVNALAKRIGCDLRQHGVSVISVEGLNFDSFLPLFGDTALKIPVAVLTDADPVPPEADPKAEVGVVAAADMPLAASAVESAAVSEEDDEDDTEPVYPALGDTITVSANTAKMKGYEDAYVKIFHGLKTFEYDLALEATNRTVMLKALAELHPKIAKSLAVTVDEQVDDAAKAKALFCGMFERPKNNVQKGSFAQSLAQVISDDEVDFTVPTYIQAAIKHACQLAAAPTP